MGFRGLVLAGVASAFWAAAAAAQPAQAPHYLELVTSAGARERVNPDRGELSLLARELETSQSRTPRSAVRMICAFPCPATLPASRPRQDVIHWEDGRRTTGPVFLYRDIVEQGGHRAGRLEDVRSIELGTAPLPRALVAGLQPRVIEAYWADPWSGGDYVVFRRPWLTLSGDSLLFQSREPIARRGNLRSLRISGRYPDGPRPWPQEDIVTWQDGTSSRGDVTIRNDVVEQPGRRPRPLGEVAYIDFRRR